MRIRSLSGMEISSKDLNTVAIGRIERGDSPERASASGAIDPWPPGVLRKLITLGRSENSKNEPRSETNGLRKGPLYAAIYGRRPELLGLMAGPFSATVRFRARFIF